MNKRKVLGVLVTLFGLIMVGGSAANDYGFGVVAPISMSLIVLAGLAMVFWEKVNSWMK